MFYCSNCAERVRHDASHGWYHCGWREDPYESGDELCGCGDGSVAQVDTEYDSDRDRVICGVCDYIATGGPTATSWEIHDHRETHRKVRET